MSVHRKLLDELRALLEGSTAKLSLDSQVDIIVKEIAPSFKPRTHPGFHALLKAVIKDLLQGRALGVEDLADLLTLKESSLDFESSLDLIRDAQVCLSHLDRDGLLLICFKSQDIPEARQISAYRTVWRRLYIRDE